MFLFYFPTSLNQQLLIQPTIELREQYQNHQNSAYNSTKPADRTDLFSRWRPGVSFKYGSKLSAQVVYQFSNDWYWTDTSNHSTNRSDLLFANVKYDTGAGNLTVGRQLIIKGNGRFFGDPDFGVTGRSFDAARYTSGKFDIFAGKLAVNSVPSKYARAAAASYSTILGESMLAYKHDLSASQVDIDIAAFDQLYRQSFHKLRFDIEAVGEEGHNGPSKLEAWAFSGKTTYSFTPTLSSYVEVDAASGGTHNGTIQTFDQFYAGNHPYYGILDVIGWRNMNDLMFGSTYKESPRATLNGEFHNFSLRSRTDALYADAGASSKTYYDASGVDGRDVGREFDLTQKYSFNEHQSVEAGVAIFKPGRFIASFTKGSLADEYWVYAQYKVKF